MNIDLLVKEILSGDKRAIARGISIVENDTSEKNELLKKIYPSLGKAYRIGLTGPPGAGKSTMILQLTKELTKKDYNVGIIAVDPTSPFSGGAILGDRVRMSELISDNNIFIRSMASRGSKGGLSISASEASDILEASGKDVIIFETLGVGQSELDISTAADTTIVVIVPESGDSIQAMKAGLMEIADIFVVNKSDREGADRAVKELELILSLRTREMKWHSPVIKASAMRGEGITEINDEIEKHKKFITKEGLYKKKRKDRLVNRIKEIIETRLYSMFWNEKRNNSLQEYYNNIDKSDISPYEISARFIQDFTQEFKNK